MIIVSETHKVTIGLQNVGPLLSWEPSPSARMEAVHTALRMGQAAGLDVIISADILRDGIFHISYARPSDVTAALDNLPRG